MTAPDPAGAPAPGDPAPGDPPAGVMIDHLRHERDTLLELAQDLIDRLSVTIGEDGTREYSRRFVDAITRPIGGPQ